jgi:monolysocardiolipin acyltransferase
MPEGRRIPFKFIPRLGVKLSVTFGDPIPLEDFKASLEDIKVVNMGQTGSTKSRAGNGVDSDIIRSSVTATIQRAVERLGREVSGNLLHSN